MELVMSIESSNITDNPKVRIFLKKLLRACSNSMNYHPIIYSANNNNTFNKDILLIGGVNNIPREDQALFRGLAGEQRPLFLENDVRYSEFFNILKSEYINNITKTDIVLGLKELWKDLDSDIGKTAWGNVYCRWINSKVLHTSIDDLQDNYLRYSNEQILSCSIYVVAKISNVCMKTFESLRKMEEFNHILSTSNIYYRNPESK